MCLLHLVQNPNPATYFQSIFFVSYHPLLSKFPEDMN